MNRKFDNFYNRARMWDNKDNQKVTLTGKYFDRITPETLNERFQFINDSFYSTLNNEQADLDIIKHQLQNSITDNQSEDNLVESEPLLMNVPKDVFNKWTGVMPLVYEGDFQTRKQFIDEFLEQFDYYKQQDLKNLMCVEDSKNYVSFLNKDPDTLTEQEQQLSFDIIEFYNNIYMAKNDLHEAQIEQYSENQDKTKNLHSTWSSPSKFVPNTEQSNSSSLRMNRLSIKPLDPSNSNKNNFDSNRATLNFNILKPLTQDNTISNNEKLLNTPLAFAHEGVENSNNLQNFTAPSLMQTNYSNNIVDLIQKRKDMKSNEENVVNNLVKQQSQANKDIVTNNKQQKNTKATKILALPKLNK